MTYKQTLPMALTAFGLPHAMGYMATKSGENAVNPLGATGLMDAAVEMGMAGVEIPIPAKDPAALDALIGEVNARGLRLLPSASVLVDTEVAEIQAYIKAATAVGSKVVRFVLSKVLCGDRRTLGSDWESHLLRSADRLKEVLPFAEAAGVCIAIENHQDATSDDLLRLADLTGNSPFYGVTLDTGNPLAVGEDPVEFATKVAHLIRHVHAKDYTIHFAPEGYRLVRCAAGDGVVDYPKIFEIVRGNGHDVLPGNEIAAQQTRTVPMLEPGWWECYPPRSAAVLAGALRVLWKSGRPMDEPYSSAWERGEDSATVVAEEWDRVRRSTEYFRTILA